MPLGRYRRIADKKCIQPGKIKGGEVALTNDQHTAFTLGNTGMTTATTDNKGRLIHRPRRAHLRGGMVPAAAQQMASGQGSHRALL
ncbi:hypothetical protein ACS33_15445 [Edwardsiella ictaluri]|nr:hypothetical protein ACS33_15445 [Edwardsiella ictaluri]